MNFNRPLVSSTTYVATLSSPELVTKPYRDTTLIQATVTLLMLVALVSLAMAITAVAIVFMIVMINLSR